eukprot:6896797-Prorocentrum_lima.AAC.1
MTNIYEEEGNELYGIARYPIDEWIALGEPIMTVKHWVKLCLRIATGDIKSLSRLLSICTAMEANL